MADRELINPNNNAQPSGWNDADWEALIRTIRAEQCTPFLGAGACAGVLPLGGDIARHWAAQDKYSFSDQHNLVRGRASSEGRATSSKSAKRIPAG